MASQRFEKDSKEWEMWRELWVLVQRYYVPEDTDAYHEAVLRDTAAFDDKYKTPWSRAFAQAVIKAISETERTLGWTKGGTRS